MGRPEVGPVAREGVDPLLLGIIESLGDEVRRVTGSAAGHGDVRRRRAGGVGEGDVGAVDGLALTSWTVVA